MLIENGETEGTRIREAEGKLAKKRRDDYRRRVEKAAARSRNIRYLWVEYHQSIITTYALYL